MHVGDVIRSRLPCPKGVRTGDLVGWDSRYQALAVLRRRTRPLSHVAPFSVHGYRRQPGHQFFHSKTGNMMLVPTMPYPGRRRPVITAETPASVYPQLRGHLAEYGLIDARRRAGRFRFANPPTGATLDEFDFDRDLLADVGTRRCLGTATDVLLIGPPASTAPLSRARGHDDAARRPPDTARDRRARARAAARRGPAVLPTHSGSGVSRARHRECSGRSAPC